uniref:S-adenosyl-L-methionine-dependent methyltransferase n=1 Tax=Kalanchoe fedtschenkoi TaxID=63787 RepID=A0A7N0VEF8_KALFE
MNASTLTSSLVRPQIRPPLADPVRISSCIRHPFHRNLTCSLKTRQSLKIDFSPTAKYQKANVSDHQPRTQEDGIPFKDVKMLAKFKSRFNYIRVLEVSRRADHPFAGARLLLLDDPGNIHSINFNHKLLTDTYFDVFATLPPILPPGPVGILGFGAGSSAKLLLELYPELVVHGWEIDPSVISVGREYFDLGKIEKEHKDRIFVHIGDAFRASVKDGFAGILVDLFSKGSVVPELQDATVWARLKCQLREGGRIMVNVRVEVMEETLEAVRVAFGDEVHVLRLGNKKDDSSVAVTGPLPELAAWNKALPRSLRHYVDMWAPYTT